MPFYVMPQKLPDVFRDRSKVLRPHDFVNLPVQIRRHSHADHHQFRIWNFAHWITL